jgi:hypothetical protein
MWRKNIRKYNKEANNIIRKLWLAKYLGAAIHGSYTDNCSQNVDNSFSPPLSGSNELTQSI